MSKTDNNSIAERGKALENAYFAKRDRELIEAIKKGAKPENCPDRNKCSPKNCKCKKASKK